MSAVARRTGAVDRRPGLRRIAGSRFEVDNQITAYRAAGRLKSKTRPVPVPGQPQIVEAYVVLSDPPRRVPWQAVAGVALAIVGALVWWVVANLAAILAVLAGVLLVGGVVVLVALLSGGCEITVIHRRR
jgi:hypothetical protein